MRSAPSLFMNEDALFGWSRLVLAHCLLEAHERKIHFLYCREMLRLYFLVVHLCIQKIYLCPHAFLVHELGDEQFLVGARKLFSFAAFKCYGLFPLVQCLDDILFNKVFSGRKALFCCINGSGLLLYVFFGLSSFLCRF